MSNIEASNDSVEMSPKEADETLKIIKDAIHEIYNHNDRLEFQELYSIAKNMVLGNYGDRLYLGLVATMTAHLKEMAKSIEAAQRGSFLEELNRKWNDHNKALLRIKYILSYMDRSYIPNIRRFPLRLLGLKLWSHNVIYSVHILFRLLNIVLELLIRVCIGEVIDRKIISNINKMLKVSGSSHYGQEYRIYYRQLSDDFSQLASQRFIKCCDIDDYLRQAKRFLNDIYMDPNPKTKIDKVVKMHMTAKLVFKFVHMKLKNSGLVNMLCDDNYEDMGKMYNMFNGKIHDLWAIREVMASEVRKSCKQLVKRSKDPVKFVQRLLDEQLAKRSKDPGMFVRRLLDEKDKYDKIINLAFNNDKSFQNALNSSFEYVINLNPLFPKFISLFVDDKLRKCQKGVNEDDVEVTLDKVMMLFRYLQGKDVFEMYYKQHLAKRLLSGKTVSDDAERSLIVKLKTECGYQFTSKLEGMFTDMKTSQDTMQGFYASHPDLGDGPTLTVQVLTTGSWPTQSSITCNLPVEISALCEKFRSYYLGTNTGRRLSWQTNMGFADLKATFGKGQKHELNVSTYQMCVLMLFNNADKLSYKEIEQATEIPAPDLKRCLQSLALVKGRNVLRKEPMSKDVGEDDAFSVNDKFSSKLYKVKIGTVVAQKESEPEKQETRQRVEEDRKPQIEVAIVRIMKSRKQLDHNNLIAEVTKQLQARFLANPTEVKKRIESLIERDFLERGDNDRKMYRYLA